MWGLPVLPATPPGASRCATGSKADRQSLPRAARSARGPGVALQWQVPATRSTCWLRADRLAATCQGGRAHCAGRTAQAACPDPLPAHPPCEPMGQGGTECTHCRPGQRWAHHGADGVGRARAGQGDEQQAVDGGHVAEPRAGRGGADLGWSAASPTCPWSPARLHPCGPDPSAWKRVRNAHAGLAAGSVVRLAWPWSWPWTSRRRPPGGSPQIPPTRPAELSRVCAWPSGT